MPAKPEPRQNHLLAALSPEVQARLFPYLELVPLPLRSVMYESGRTMRHVYFPTDCEPASKLDEISGRTGVEVGPGMTREIIKRICGSHHSGVVNGGRQLLVKAGRRLTRSVRRNSISCPALRSGSASGA
jgi:hypothetical protein